MRTLMISEHFFNDPHNAVFGTHQRMRMLIDAAKSLGELDVLLFVNEGFEMSPTSVAKWQTRLSEHWETDITLLPCRRVGSFRRMPPHRILALLASSARDGAVSFYPSRLSVQTAGNEQVRAFEKSLKRRPDVILAHRIGAMAPVARSRIPRPPVLFDLDDIQHVKYRRMVKSRGDLSFRLRFMAAYPLLRRAEKRSLQLARTTFVCSEKDRIYLERSTGATGIAVIPNGVSMPTLTPRADEPRILFLGTYQYHPNIDAAIHLAEEIWPLIRRERPDARLVLAGACPEKLPNRIRSLEGVECPGFIADLDNLYQRTQLVACTIRVGGGTRIKILEACAYRKPVVATHIAAEGIELVDGEEIVLEDDPQRFARACLELLADSDRRHVIGDRARARVGHLYERGSIVEKIAEHLRTAAAETTPSLRG